MPPSERDAVSWQIVTEEQRQLLHADRRIGGLCAACGRDLTKQEAIWYEHFTMPGMGATISSRTGSVGVRLSRLPVQN